MSNRFISAEEMFRVRCTLRSLLGKKVQDNNNYSRYITEYRSSHSVKIEFVLAFCDLFRGEMLFTYSIMFQNFICNFIPANKACLSLVNFFGFFPLIDL